jgi:hypothetical protein
MATERVAAFVTNPETRLKVFCPDFGRFLPLLLLSDTKWLPSAEAAAGSAAAVGAIDACIQESFTRNALWIVKSNNDLQCVICFVIFVILIFFDLYRSLGTCDFSGNCICVVWFCMYFFWGGVVLGWFICCRISP